jgi:hypothetical protein
MNHRKAGFMNNCPCGKIKTLKYTTHTVEVSQRMAARLLAVNVGAVNLYYQKHKQQLMMRIYIDSVFRCKHLRETRQSIPPARQRNTKDNLYLDHSLLGYDVVLTGHYLSTLRIKNRQNLISKRR